MASTVTKPVSARIRNEDVARFRAQAERFGLTTSQAIAALIGGALALERQRATKTPETTNEAA